MSRRKRMMDKKGKGPHQNKYASYSHATEAAEDIKRREKGIQIHPESRKEERKSYDKQVMQQAPSSAENGMRVQETSPETPEKKLEGLVKILYVTNEPHDDKVEGILKKAGFECHVVYTRKEAENALPNGSYAGVFIENLRIGLDKGTQVKYSDGIEFARNVKAAGLPLVVFAEDVFGFINRVKGIGQGDRVIQKPSDSDYYLRAAKSVFKK